MSLSQQGPDDTAPRRCESCGRFVSRNHLKTARYFYDIARPAPVAVYSLATATRFQERLDCADCSAPCCRMREAERGHGSAVGVSLPGGWEQCSPQVTQATITERTTP